MSKEVSTDENVPMVTLVSLDEQRFTLPIAAAKESKMVFNALGSDDDSSELMEQDEVNEVDCLKVTGACLEQVVKFLNHQHSIERMKRIIMPLRGNTFDEVCTIQQHKPQQQQQHGSKEHNTDGAKISHLHARLLANPTVYETRMVSQFCQ